MAEIKAFVAHSFRPEDKELIQIFIDHFDSLEGSLPGFSWDHALQAEATSVSGKVLAKIADKNVFIGICARYEYVTPRQAAFRLPLKFFGFKAADIQWKTSDWLIQEIGLALGHKMKVIIFLEENVREPGGLFGDDEYIRFTRTSPQASFDKLLQMLGTLMPKSISDTSAVTAKPVTSDQPKDQDESMPNLVPQLSWDQSDYDAAAFRAIIQRDAEAASMIDSAYRESPLSKGNALPVWEARIEWLKMTAYQAANFGKIKDAVKADPTNTKLLSYMASGYAKYGEHLLAADVYEQAGALEKDEARRVHLLIDAAKQYVEAGQKYRSDEIIEMLKPIVSKDSKLKDDLLSYLKGQAEAEKDEHFQLAVMEEIVFLQPTSTDARFALAYQHSQAGNNDMALYHYDKIPIFARKSMTWNNLGAAYDEFGMSIKSVEVLVRSANENETLAMSNLGFKLLHSGFLKEAREQADRAVAIESYHGNVNELLKRLKEAPEEEEAKLRETLGKVKEKAAFYRKAGQAVLKPTPSNIASSWNSPTCVLEAKIDGGSIRMVGTYQRPYGGGIGLGLLNSTTGGLGQATVTETIEYTGRLRGHVIVGEVKQSASPQSPLASGGDSTKIMMLLNDDHTELFVAERPDSVTPQFYTVARSQSK